MGYEISECSCASDAHHIDIFSFPVIELLSLFCKYSLFHLLPSTVLGVLGFAYRSDTVNKSFPGSLLVDDFIQRLEIGLFSYGFNGDNSIGKTKLPRRFLFLDVSITS